MVANRVDAVGNAISLDPAFRLATFSTLGRDGNLLLSE